MFWRGNGGVFLRIGWIFVLRLIPAGHSIFGSSLEEIEYAIQLDKERELFSLDNERPQFEAFLAAYYIGVYTVTNEQFARFLSETRPSAADLCFWIPWRDRIRSP
jgi:formylglycine-generating enzyme required for sulfatase activity